MRIEIVLVSALITGCVTVSPPDYKPTINRISGLPVSLIVATLGPPTDQQDVAGQHWHTWSTGQYVSYPDHSFGSYWCRLMVHDEFGVATGVRIQGNRGGCNPMLKAFFDGPAP